MISKGHMEPTMNKTEPCSKTIGKNEGVHIETITLNLKLAVLTVSMEKAMAPHSSTLAWKIPWMEEPGGLQSMGSRRIGHN